MSGRDKKIQRTNTMRSSDLDRYRGTVKLIQQAWDNLPDDIDFTEREMFIEISSKVLTLQNTLRERDKDTDTVN